MDSDGIVAPQHETDGSRSTWLRRNVYKVIRILVEILAVVIGIYVLLDRSTTFGDVVDALQRIR